MRQVRRNVTLLAVGMLLLASPAFAQRVAVLPIHGDSGALRRELEAGLGRGGGLELVSTRSYDAAVAKAGARSDAGAGVAAVAADLHLDGGLGGQVRGKSFSAELFDASGGTAWTQTFPLTRGALNPRQVKAIGSAVSRALKGRAQPGAEAAPSGELGLDLSGGSATPAPSGGEPTTMPGLDLTPTTPPTPGGSAAAATEPVPSAGAAAPESTEAEAPSIAATPQTGAPALFSARLAITGSWRFACARPGVTTCAQYDATTPRPAGQTVDFFSDAPYLGGALAVELLPLARSESLLRGLGLAAGGHLAYSLTTVEVSSPVNTAEAKKVTASDTGFNADVLLRFYFPLGAEGLLGYGGLKLGVQGQTFSVPAEGAPLLGSHRLFPEGEVELSLPFSRLAVLELAGGLLLNPTPGADERAAYGATATSNGFEVEGGLSGMLTPTFGYVAHVKWMRFADVFSGGGDRWSDGGAAEENFVTVSAGAVAHF